MAAPAKETDDLSGGTGASEAVLPMRVNLPWRKLAR